MSTDARAAIRVFGFNGWHLENGKKVCEFPDEPSIKAYIRTIKTDEHYCGGRCRHYTNKWTYEDDVAVLLVEWDGRIYGHYAVKAPEMPSEEDKRRYPPVRKGGRVYLVEDAVPYPKPIALKQLNAQFGRKVERYKTVFSPDEFNEIRRIGGC
jgi:hypothetical protein